MWPPLPAGTRTSAVADFQGTRFTFVSGFGGKVFRYRWDRHGKISCRSPSIPKASPTQSSSQWQRLQMPRNGARENIRKDFQSECRYSFTSRFVQQNAAEFSSDRMKWF